MRFCILVFVLVFLPSALLAQEAEPAEIHSRYVYLVSKYSVNDDGTHVEEHEWAAKIIDERAVKHLKQTSISYSTSIQKAEILSAYTIKADGRRIDAPKTNYQVETNKGRGKDQPVFSDTARLTVVFPEVQVGDTVVFSHRITQTEAMFPGHFTTSFWYSTDYPYDKVQVTLDLPKTFPGRFSVRGMKQSVSMKDNRKIITLKWANKHPLKRERKNFSVWNEESEPGYVYSTFKSYEEIAATYGKRANPKAHVTDRVRRLASKIVGREKNRKEQARLLYEWVAINISYAGNCIGVGAVVPHDLDFVLDNRMGDCKDHSTLLQALLAAQSIKSTQALINAGSAYKLLSIPTVSSVNHVLNYLPDFDLFVDSTSPSTPFGMLPFSVTDKPVLLVEGFRPGMKTPVLPMGSNEQRMETVVRIAEDGSASGEITVRQKGRFAVSMRARMREMTKAREAEMIKNVFRSETRLGKGSIEKDDPGPLLNTYRYKVNFEKGGFIQRSGAGAFYIGPLFPSDGPVYQFIASAASQPEPAAVSCSNGYVEERYTYIFPKDVRILAKPDDMKVGGKYLDYTATYRIEGNVLKVMRAVNDKSPASICPPAVIQDQRTVGIKAIQNLKSQVVYR